MKHKLVVVLTTVSLSTRDHCYWIDVQAVHYLVEYTVSEQLVRYGVAISATEPWRTEYALTPVISPISCRARRSESIDEGIPQARKVRARIGDDPIIPAPVLAHILIVEDLGMWIHQIQAPVDVS